MASTEQSATLGLSLWEPTDMPERLDFRHDNEQLETLVGGHLANELIHMTTGEKNFLQKPYAVTFCKGTGNANCYELMPLPPANVQAIFVFRADKPFLEPGANGQNTVYSDYWINSFGGVAPCVTGGAITVSGNNVCRKNTTVGSNVYKLNEKNCWYATLFLAKV